MESTNWLVGVTNIYHILSFIFMILFFPSNTFIIIKFIRKHVTQTYYHMAGCYFSWRSNRPVPKNTRLRRFRVACKRMHVLRNGPETTSSRSRFDTRHDDTLVYIYLYEGVVGGHRWTPNAVWLIFFWILHGKRTRAHWKRLRTEKKKPLPFSRR